MMNVPGISTITSTEVTDFNKLGRWVAAARSENQAAFLVGLAQEFSGFDGDRFWGLMQMHYISDELNGTDSAADVKWFLDELNARVN